MRYLVLTIFGQNQPGGLFAMNFLSFALIFLILKTCGFKGWIWKSAPVT